MPASSRPAATSFDPNAPERVETATYALQLVSDAPATSAQPSVITLVIEGRGAYHLNLEYPLRVELQASSGAELAQTSLGPSDARELAEAGARFDARVRWTGAGQHWLAVRVQFAVCTPDSCVPHEQLLATRLQVQ